MESSVDQVLEKAIAAHREGKLDEAELFYRSILQSQPLHPDANHNLGVIAFSVGKVGEALPLFKSALEANPKIEQYWLSYIGGLVKEDQFEAAENALEQAKNQGIDNAKLNLFKAQMVPTPQIGNTDAASPSHQQLNTLVKHYQHGRFNDAENLALSITQTSPMHPFAWKVLGALFVRSRRYAEAINANQTVVSLSPQDAEAHSNLGISLQELGRFSEAEASCRQATALNPSFAEAHNNLGNALQRLGRLDDSEASYRQAITLKSDYTEAHSSLGSVLQKLDRLDDAEASHRRAIALEPDFVTAHNNLAVTLQKLGRLEEAETGYRQAIALKPDFAEAHCNLGNTLQELGRLEEAETSYRQAIGFKRDHADARNNLGNTLQELGRFGEAEASYREAIVLKSNFADAHNNLGSTLKELGRFDEAEENYTRAIALKPDYIEAIRNRWRVLFDQGRYEAALGDAERCARNGAIQYDFTSLYALGRTEDIYKRLQEKSRIDGENRSVAAFAAFFAQSEKKHTAYNFCPNPIDFVYFSSLSSHLKEPNSYIKVLIEELDKVKTSWEPAGKTTKIGFQTLKTINLFDAPSEEILQLKSIIIRELDAYYEKFHNERCSYIRKWPSEYNLAGWHVVLKKQGHQNLHMHPGGWLSGVIYLQVVPSLGKEEGAIEFSLNGEDYFDVNSPKLTFQPKAGDIVFFPSSLHHRTIPFTTDSNRVIVSFDLKP